ncbi:MAG: hypothetical protein JW982_11970 [Spirochaetes bacterium]|nr:hypothetical protein [Spirochaetota bacterium]
MNREHTDKMDINVTHYLSSRENSPERGKSDKTKEFYLSNFSNVTNTGIRQ